MCNPCQTRMRMYGLRCLECKMSGPREQIRIQITCTLAGRNTRPVIGVSGLTKEAVTLQCLECIPVELPCNLRSTVIQELH
jgi:hypothetical protein